MRPRRPYWRLLLKFFRLRRKYCLQYLRLRRPSGTPHLRLSASRRAKLEAHGGCPVATFEAHLPRRPRNWRPGKNGGFKHENPKALKWDAVLLLLLPPTSKWTLRQYISAADVGMSGEVMKRSALAIAMCRRKREACSQTLGVVLRQANTCSQF